MISFPLVAEQGVCFHLSFHQMLHASDVSVCTPHVLRQHTTEQLSLTRVHCGAEFGTSAPSLPLVMGKASIRVQHPSPECSVASLLPSLERGLIKQGGPTTKPDPY